MLQKRFQEILNYFLEGKNWGKIFGALVFFYLFLSLIWLNTTTWWETFTFNDQAPSHSLRWFVLTFVLSFIFWILSLFWTKGKAIEILNRQTRTFILLAIALFLLIILPTLKFWPNFNSPWWTLNINYYFWHFQIFGLAISFVVIVYYWLFESIFKTKFWKIIESPKVGQWLPWILFLTGFLLYGLFQLSLYYSLGSPMRDVSIFDQAIWHLSHFQLPASTIRDMTNLWGDHFHPILILIAPFYWLKSDVRWLFIIQAAVVSAGVFPIFWIAKEKFKSNFAGFVFAFAWLFFLGVQHAIRFGFYPETLSITFLAFAFFFFFKKRIWQYFLFVILALACKENIALYVVFLGLWIFFFEKQKWVGIFTFILGLAWFKITEGWLIEHFANSTYSYFHYEQFGKTPIQVIKTLVLNPFYSFKILISPDQKIETMLYYFVPFGFLSFFSPLAITLIPSLGEKFLSSDPKLYSMGYHYGANAVTFLVIAAILGVNRILNIKKIKKLNVFYHLKIGFISILILTLTVIYTFNDSTGPLLSFKKLTLAFPENYTEAIKLIPRDKSLTAQMTLGTALAHRNEIYWWSDDQSQKLGDYILLSCNYATFPYSQEQNIKRIKDLIASGEYGVRYSQGDIILFERGLEEGQSLSKEMEQCLGE